MSINHRPQYNGHSVYALRYRTTFRKRVFTLLKMGYDLLDKLPLRNEEEPAITGELVQAMNNIVRIPDQPKWLYQLAIQDDPPLNTTDRRGKSRPRADLTIEQTGDYERWSFTFEAKRFYEHSGVVKYLGNEGLGMFTCGIYAPYAEEVGMLGYVQIRDIAHWESKLFDALAQNNPQSQIIVRGLDTFHSEHQRNSGKSFTVWHILILF